MNPYYNQDYTYEEIDETLRQFKDCVTQGRYLISIGANRQENIDFINRYRIRAARRKEILLQIRTEDFCHTLQNTHPGFEKEVLYVFVPQVMLDDSESDQHVIVDVYVKFNMIEGKLGNRTVIISFHERNRPIDYLFR